MGTKRGKYSDEHVRRLFVGRYGDVTPEELFWSHVQKSSGCWEWQKSVSHGKYGQAYVRGRRWAAHRLSWTLTNGAIPPGLKVCHRCDNMKCVRPDHLFLGTQADNLRDMRQKGRHRLAQGQDGRFVPTRGNCVEQ